RVFATATGRDQLVALDESTGTELGRVPTGRFPDGVAFDPTSTRMLVSNKDGGTVTVLDARTLEPLGIVAVGGDVGNVQTSGDRVVVAVGQTNQLLELDSATLRVTDSIALPGCSGAHGVALDASQPTAYVACENNANVVVVDLMGRRIAARLHVGDQPDVLAL